MGEPFSFQPENKYERYLPVPATSFLSALGQLRDEELQLLHVKGAQIVPLPAPSLIGTLPSLSFSAGILDVAESSFRHTHTHTHTHVHGGGEAAPAAFLGRRSCSGGGGGRGGHVHPPAIPGGGPGGHDGAAAVSGAAATAAAAARMRRHRQRLQRVPHGQAHHAGKGECFYNVCTTTLRFL